MVGGKAWRGPEFSSPGRHSGVVVGVGRGGGAVCDSSYDGGSAEGRGGDSSDEDVGSGRVYLRALPSAGITILGVVLFVRLG